MTCRKHKDDVKTAGGRFCGISSEVRKMLDDAGLVCPSLAMAQEPVQTGIDAAKILGAKYLVAGACWKKDVPASKATDVLAVLNSLTLDDYKWNADLFNKNGEAARTAGLTFDFLLSLVPAPASAWEQKRFPYFDQTGMEDGIEEFYFRRAGIHSAAEAADSPSRLRMRPGVPLGSSSSKRTIICSFSSARSSFLTIRVHSSAARRRSAI